MIAVRGQAKTYITRQFELVQQDDLDEILAFCEHNYGTRYTRWDYSYQDMMYVYRDQDWFYYRVEFTFEHREDLVMFMLRYNTHD